MSSTSHGLEDRGAASAQVTRTFAPERATGIDRSFARIQQKVNRLGVYRSPSDADAAGFAAARVICRRHARSFYFASFFLPSEKRLAAYAVYAFCRAIDDAIDRPEAGASPDNSSPQAVSAALDALGRQLDAVYDGSLRLPPASDRSEAQHAAHAFALTARRYAIPKRYFIELAEGCRMDLTVNRYATWDALEPYCYRVAGVVGLVMSRVFGLRNSDAAARAVAMGNAMQLTNILRDVKEDWDRGRVYLPLEDLARFGYSEVDLAAGVVNEPFRTLMRFEIDRARGLYRLGAEGLCHLPDDGSRLTAASMAAIYSGILDAIERRGYDVFGGRAAVSWPGKLVRASRGWKLAKRVEGEMVPEVFGKRRTCEG